MKTILSFLAICFAFALCTTSCENATSEVAAKATETVAAVVSKPDLGALKAEIQAVNNTWAAASNAKDISTVLAFYTDDAISMSDDKPAIVGKAAMLKDSETWFKNHKAGDAVQFETLEVFGDDSQLTEIGKVTTRDAAGKVKYNGKYMAIWAKRDGKWLTIRDISNDDQKEKETK